MKQSGLTKSKRSKKLPPTETTPIVVQEYSTIEFSDLVDDILLRIVQMVPKAQWPSLESVSHQLQKAVFQTWYSQKIFHFDEGFVFKKDGTENGDTILECFLKKLLLRSPYTAELTGMASIWNPGSQAIHPLGQFKCLERLSFAKIPLKFRDIFGFFKENPLAVTL